MTRNLKPAVRDWSPVFLSGVTKKVTGLSVEFSRRTDALTIGATRGDGPLVEPATVTRTDGSDHLFVSWVITREAVQADFRSNHGYG